MMSDAPLMCTIFPSALSSDGMRKPQMLLPFRRTHLALGFSMALSSHSMPIRKTEQPVSLQVLKRPLVL